MNGAGTYWFVFFILVGVPVALIVWSALRDAGKPKRTVD